jgi:uncharacterized membrane protein YcfT
MTNASSNSRIGWIEALKGITICLVVLHHVTFTAQHWLLTEHGAQLPRYMLIIDQFLSNCRMPAFFFCSGLVFSKNIYRGRSWIINKRIIGAAWIIVVWTGLSYIFEMTGLELVPWQAEQVLLIYAFWSPFGVLWFMYAIMICTIASYLLRSFSVRNQLLIALILSICAAYSGNALENPEGLKNLLDGLGASGFFFFIAGSALGSHAIRVIEDNLVSGLFILFCIPIILLYYKIGDESWILDLFGVRIPSTIVLICSVRFLVDRLKPFKNFLSLLGARSLSIFVTHQFVIALVLAMWTEYVGEAYPRPIWLFLAVLTAGGTFVAQKYIHRMTGGLAYQPPEWLPFTGVGQGR